MPLSKKSKQIPKKERLTGQSKNVATALGIFGDTMDTTNKWLDGLGGQHPEVQENPIIDSKSVHVDALDQFVTYGSVALSWLNFLINIFTYNLNKNKNINRTVNFALDGVRFAIGLVALTLAPVVIPVFFSVFIIAALFDVARSAVNCGYNFYKYKTVAASKYEGYGLRKLYRQRTKEAVAGLVIGAVLTGLSMLGLVVTAIATPVAYVVSGIMTCLLAKKIIDSNVFKNAYKWIKGKFPTQKKKTTANQSAQDPVLKEPQLGFTQLDVQTINSFEKVFNIFGRYKKFSDKSRKLNSQPGFNLQNKAARKSNERVLQAKPTNLKRFKNYDQHVIAKAVSLNGLLDKIVEQGSRIASEYFADLRQNNRHSEKRNDKFRALQDLQWILLQLDEMRKNPDKPNVITLYLNAEQMAKAKRDYDALGAAAAPLGRANVFGKVSTLRISLKDFEKNKDKIWASLNLYFEQTYPKYANSFFKETGEVKTLFESAEAWVKQKTIGEFQQGIIKLRGQYGAKENKPQSPDQIEKQSALKFLSNFMNNVEVFCNAEGLKKQLDLLARHFKRDTYINLIGDQSTSQRIYYIYDKKLGKYQMLFEYLDKNNQRSKKELNLSDDDFKERLMGYVIKIATKKYPSLKKSFESIGDVAGMFDDASKWVQMQDLSHLKSMTPPAASAMQQVPMAVPVTGVQQQKQTVAMNLPMMQQQRNRQRTKVHQAGANATVSPVPTKVAVPPPILVVGQQQPQTMFAAGAGANAGISPRDAMVFSPSNSVNAETSNQILYSDQRYPGSDFGSITPSTSEENLSTSGGEHNHHPSGSENESDDDGFIIDLVHQDNSVVTSSQPQDPLKDDEGVNNNNNFFCQSQKRKSSYSIPLPNDSLNRNGAFSFS